MKKLVAYDLDGTLADTRKDIVLGVNHMLERLGCGSLSSKEIESYVGSGLRELIRKTLKSDDRKQIDKGSKIFRDYYAGHLMDHTRLFPGVLEALDFFRPRAQMVLTNKPNPFTDRMLDALQVSRYFFEVISGDPGKLKKPDPSRFLKVLSKAAVAPEDALLIGDSPVDIETGRRAGVETVVLAHGFTPENELQSQAPDYLVPSFAALINLARKKNW